MARRVKLENYFPSVLANAREFIDIAKTENPEFQKIRDLFYKWFLNTFVYDLDEDGASRWEDMLSIVPKVTDSLEQRRQRILAKLNSMLPYTHRRLVEMLNAIYGEGKTAVSIVYDKYAVYIDLTTSLKQYVRQIWIYLRTIVPVEMGIYFTHTTQMDEFLYCGGIVSQTKCISIKTKTGFDFAPIDNKEYYGGIVRQIKYVLIKGHD